jgi:8-oxo-dGTP pyrophosphatase MutT (NUDIX family)
MACVHGHNICHDTSKGVGVCLVDPDAQRVLLGLERFGKYRNKFNVCAGSLEPEDEGCVVNAAKRELREEFKLELNTFDQHFCYGPGRTLRTTRVGPTPVLIGYFSSLALDARALTLRMRGAIDDESLPGTHKEMQEAQWFPWTDHTSLAWSRFARIVVKKVMDRKTPRLRPGGAGKR